MKLEKFNYSNGKRSRWFLCGFILAVVLMFLINLFFSEAKYFKTESVKIAEGNISYKPYDFKIMAMYQENNSGTYEEIETMPASGYVINEEKSYCTLDNVNKDSNAILKTNENGEHLFKGISKNDKCYLYFDIQPMASEIILANKTVSTRTDFSTVLTTDTTGTMYSAEDDYGTSYYFAGAPTDNWVKFAGFYWRIIRINGNGSVRLIYQGTSANTTGEGTQIGTSAFNSSYENKAYVGYMYTLGEAHGTGTDSTIKGVLDTWYNNNLASYTGNIDTNAGFCNDREITDTDSNGNLFYGAETRLFISNATPSLKCSIKEDLFKTNIGLITADEITFAGGVYQIDNTNYYLYTNQWYWTISPFHTTKYGESTVIPLGSDGWIHATFSAERVYGVRPVINLKANTQFSSGTGTASNPYVVE